MESVTTHRIRLTPARYVKHAAGIWMAQWWWMVALPLVVLIFMGLADWRYFIAVLALVCIVYPSIIMMMYFNHALRPEAAFSTFEHQIEINPQGVSITYFSPDEEARTPKPRFIPLDDIAAVEDTGSALIVTLKSGKYDFVEIPASSLQDGNMADVIKILGKKFN